MLGSETDFVPKISNGDAFKLLLRPLFLLASQLSGPEYDYNSLNINALEVDSPIREPHKVLFITDLHIRNGPYSGPEALEFVFNKVVEELSDTKHSGLLIGGDFINKTFSLVDHGSSTSVFPKLQELLRNMSDLDIPIISVEGNHDIEHPYWLSRFKPGLQDVGVKFLNTFEKVNLGEIPIIGIPDYTQPKYKDWHKLYLPFMHSLIPQYPKQLIFLAHHPDSVNPLLQIISPDWNSFIFTGHSHLSGFDMNYNWIANLLGHISLIGANVESREYVKSPITHRGKTTIINSAGLGSHPLHPPRRVMPDLTIVNFVPSQNINFQRV